MKSSVIQEGLGLELLLSQLKRSQFRFFFGHLTRMPSGHHLVKVFWACPTGKRLQGRPRTRYRDDVSRLAWDRLCVPLDELEEVASVTSPG